MLPVLALSAAHGATADFDAFPEGASSLTFVEHGLRFRDCDDRYTGSVPFVIEQADATLGGQPNFTPNNALACGGYASGPGAAFTRFGSMVIEPPAPATHAELTGYTFTAKPQTGLALEAWSGGAMVDRVFAPLGAALVATPLTIDVPSGFDELHLVVGPAPTDVTFLLLDHVVVDGTPVLDTGEVGHSEVPQHSAEVVHSAELHHSGVTEPSHSADTDTDDPPATTDDGDTVPTDASTGGDEDGGGCGCASGPGAAGWPALLGAVALLGRRRARAR